MKKTQLAAALFGALSAPVFAQNSVTLYGLIDAGISFSNNSAGHKLYEAQSGIAQGSRWGLKGSEDLGGGTKAIFQLENGFDAFTGRLGQGGLEFGRQAYVGLTNTTWGSLTIGRQYDPIVDIVQPATFNGQAGALFSHPSDLDNTDNGFRVNNAVKYVTPTLLGLTGEAMYGFGGVAGSFGRNSTIAAGASFANGPLYLGVAYFYAKDPATQFADGNFQPNGQPGVSNGAGALGYVGIPSNMQVIGAGGTYSIGQAQVGLDYTNTRFDNSSGLAGNTVTFNNYEAWAQYHLTPSALLGGGYTFTEGKVDFNGAKPKYNQFNLFADYSLSKRTDVYLMGIYQKSSGGANADIYEGLLGSQSSTTSQLAARVGIRHKF